MAQTRKKRRRKHRGTQAGTVERRTQGKHSPARASRPMTAEERRHERLSTPPTWRGTLNRAALAAIFFGVIAYLILDRTVAQAAVLAAFALIVYVPMSYYTDQLMHRRYMRKHGHNPRR